MKEQDEYNDVSLKLEKLCSEWSVYKIHSKRKEPRQVARDLLKLT